MAFALFPRTSRSLLARAVLAGLLSLTSFAASAQVCPAGVTLVVGFTPGGSNDVIARTLAPRLSEVLGTPVIVDNKPGAAGAIGTAFVVNSKPDGCTMTLGSTSVLSIGPHTNPHLPYLPSDLTAVATVASSASVVSINPAVPAKTLAELIALAKTRQVSLASAGAGGISHLNIELLKADTGADFLHVPYKGAAPGVNDVVGGQVEGIIMDYSALQSMINQGRMRGIAGSKTIGAIPASDMVIAAWYGVMAPAKTPRSTINALHAAFTKVLEDPTVQANLAKLGIEPFVQPTPEQADAYIRADSARWGALIKSSGIKFD
jgi:tripartite-type tricarboxylate transporter receptor subunit TctC